MIPVIQLGSITFRNPKFSLQATIVILLVLVVVLDSPLSGALTSEASAFL
jgi:hypothetical protein